MRALPAVVSDALSRVVDCCAPERVVLFGSYAKGTETPLSDIDLLVVASTKEPPGYRELRLRHLFSTWPVPVDVLVQTPDEFEEALLDRHSFLTSIAERGVLLYLKSKATPLLA